MFVFYNYKFITSKKLMRLYSKISHYSSVTQEYSFSLLYSSLKKKWLLYSRYFFYLITLLDLSNEISSSSYSRSLKWNFITLPNSGNEWPCGPGVKVVSEYQWSGTAEALSVSILPHLLAFKDCGEWSWCTSTRCHHIGTIASHCLLGCNLWTLWLVLSMIERAAWTIVSVSVSCSIFPFPQVLPEIIHEFFSTNDTENLQYRTAL